MADLGLLKVGGDPEVVERNDGKDVLAGGEVGAGNDALLVDDAGRGGLDLGIAKVELGLIDSGLGLGDGCVGGAGTGLLDLHLLRRVPGGLLGLRLRGGETGLGLVDGVLLRGRLRLGLSERGLGGVGGGDGSVELLLGDDVLLHERGVAVDVELGLGGISLGLSDAGFGGLLLALGLGYCGLRGADVCGGGLYAGAGVGRW